MSRLAAITRPGRLVVSVGRFAAPAAGQRDTSRAPADGRGLAVLGLEQGALELERRPVEPLPVDDVELEGELGRQHLGQRDREDAVTRGPEVASSIDLGQLHVTELEGETLGKVADLIRGVVLEEDHPVPGNEVVVDPDLRQHRRRLDRDRRDGRRDNPRE